MTEDSQLERVICPPEKFITANLWEVKSAIEEGLPPDQVEQFKDFAKLIEAISQFDSLEVRKHLKHDLRPFSAAATKQMLHPERGRESPSDAELDDRELRFVENFDKLMAEAHYQRLSKEEWETAEREEFTFTMPVEVNWDKIDTNLLGRFWKARKSELQQSAAISDRVLVYHRGIGTAKAPGLYINEKIDLLVQYLIVKPIMHMFGKVITKVGVPEAITKVAHDSEENLTLVHGMPTADMNHNNVKVAYRASLGRLMPTPAAVFQLLFKNLELQEPQFKNVVVLYRTRVTGEAAAPLERLDSMVADNLTAKSLLDFNKRLERRNIHIKRFVDVPMADTELIFPDKNIYLKPVVLIQLLVTIIGGLVAAFGVIWGTKIDWSLAASALGILGARAAQVYTTAQLQRQRMQDAMTRGLYEKAQDAQEGVLHVLLDEMTEQLMKETLLAYFTLLRSESGLTQKELDARCEKWLEAKFYLRIDFAMPKTVEQLLKFGLATKDEQGVLHALPLDKALEILNARWDDYFEYQESPTSHFGLNFGDTISQLHQASEAKTGLFGGSPAAAVRRKDAAVAQGPQQPTEAPPGQAPGIPSMSIAPLASSDAKKSTTHSPSGAKKWVAKKIFGSSSNKES